MTHWIDRNTDHWDAELAHILADESKKQEDYITLIASENYITPRLLECYSNTLILNNEYAEGYVGARYYGGCHYVDQIESLAIERAKKLFDVEYVNVQPHAGSQANAAALMALLSPGDCLLGMKLAHGGHLTHGSKINFSGHFYTPIAYGVNAEGIIDYEEVEALAKQHRPKLIIAGCSAYSRVIDWARFREIADKVEAYLLADIAHIAGLVVAGLHPSPVSFADVITTTTHKTLRGPRGGMILARDAEFAKRKKINRALFPGLQGGPLVHMIAAKAAAFYEALQPEFKVYQMQVLRNAKAMVEVMQARGFPIFSGGTENHLFLVDLRERAISGKEAESQLEAAHIISNRNMLPNAPSSETNGLRFGTPAITTRGCEEKEARDIASWIADILDTPHDIDKIDEIRGRVIKLCQRFPIYNI